MRPPTPTSPTLALLAAVLLAGAAPARAQLQVSGERDLDFGELLGGVPTTISRTDPLGSGQILIRAPRNTQVEVTLLLPTELAGPAGATVPLSFPPGSAGWAPWSIIWLQQAFDPNVPNTFQVGFFGQSSIYLGGTATAPPQAPAGTYSNTITATVAYVNN